MRFLALVSSLALVVSAQAALVPQQRGTPCDAAWDVGTAQATPGAKPRQPWDAICADGDPGCDLDGAENGECRLTIAACAAVPTEGCTPTTVRKVVVPRATRKVLPTLAPPPVRTAGCGEPVTLELPVSHAPVALTLRSGKRGVSRVRVRCTPLDQSRRQKALSLLVPTTVSDFDWGQGGNGHNYRLWLGARLNACLSSCDDVTDPACAARVCTPQSLPPLGLLSNGVPICVVVHVDEGAALGTFDLRSGALSLPATLRADVHVQTPLDDVCPRCSGGSLGAVGRCTSGERHDQACTVDAYGIVVGSPNPGYFLSSDCPPDSGKLVASLPITTTLTTGNATLAGSNPCPGQAVDDACGAGTCTVDCSGTTPTWGGINQTCCSTNPSLPCFPTAPDGSGSLVRTGVAVPLTPAWRTPANSRIATGAVLAGTFCSPKTLDPTIDDLYGLAGPGALLLPVDMEVYPVIAPP